MQTMDGIYREYAQTVYRCLLSGTGDPDTAEEAPESAGGGIVSFAGSAAAVQRLPETVRQAIRQERRSGGESAGQRRTRGKALTN